MVVILIINFLVRISLSHTLQVDDREQIVYAQELLWGYPMPQPPLYSWLSWFMFKIFGSNLFALSLLKYLLIFLMFYIIWLIADKVFVFNSSKYIALYSFLLMPSFAWHMHQGFTHTILLGLGIVLSLHSLVLIKEIQHYKNYLYLGFAFGVGIMSKYSFIIFMIAILLSALSIPSLRKNLLNIKIFLSLFVFFILIGPHLIWLQQNFIEISMQAQSRLLIDNEGLIIEKIKAIFSLLIASLGFVTPLLFFFLITCWREIFIKKNNITKTSYEKIFSNFYLLIILSCLILAIFFTMPYFKVRWLHPIMMIFQFWLLLRIESKREVKKKVRKGFVYFVIFLTSLVLIIRVFQLTFGPQFGIYGRLNTPIIETLEKIPREHFVNSIIYTDSYTLIAHLLTRFSNPMSYGKKLFNYPAELNFDRCIKISERIIDSEKVSDMKSTNIVSTKFGDKEYKLYYLILPKTYCI